ncbi:MAG: hypothetical protein AAGA54_35305 [Myxococcota bacterium]
MLTLVFETTRERAEAIARLHLPETIPMPDFRVVGRLVAVQSDFFDLLGEGALQSLATSAGLPLRSIVDRPPFDEEPEALAAPEVRVTQGRPRQRPRLALMQGHEDA